MRRSHDREEDLPQCGGCYTLVIVLSKQRSIRVGKLGKFLFLKGTYLYTGSAMAGLRRRIARHLRKRKKLHWHIDYLLNCAGTAVKGVMIHRSSSRQECLHNKRIFRLPGARVTVPGFGSSDCRADCPSHLVYFVSKPKRLAR
ncbi:MAG TPA: GIY-YIG nuclease family protein [Candidatus Limnocylindrales bacterium]|nr:GIY-YIG nuclease family protein [Candidatus Limnocylindrales bacterium]